MLDTGKYCNYTVQQDGFYMMYTHFQKKEKKKNGKWV